MAREQQHMQMVSSREQIPTAIGDVRYVDRAAIEHRMQRLPRRARRARQPVRRAVPHRAVTRHRRRRAAQRPLSDRDAYLAALGEALRVEYEAIVDHGFLLQLDCPDLAMERHISYQDRPLGDFLGFVDRVVATINAALVNVPREKVRLHACWGNYEGPHDCDVELQEIMPILRKLECRRLRAAVRQPAPCARIPRCWRTSRSIRTRSSSPA